MKKLFLLISLSLFSIFSAQSQTITTPSNTAWYYVQNVLLGNYVGIANVTSTCVFQDSTHSSLGEFHNFNLLNIPINDGILFSSGHVQITNTVNNSGSSGTSLNISGDSLLNTLVAPWPTYDAAVIEFEYIPYTNVLSFKYIFASEEYPEYVGSSFNDVFGFFVDGLNPWGGWYVNKNIAIVPGTINTPVSINNINNGSTNAGPCLNCLYYLNNSSGTVNQNFTFDGLTTDIDAILDVIPFTSYHIKLAVADVGDGVFDSEVLLKQNSFACQPLQYTYTSAKSSKSGNKAKEDSASVSINITLPDTALTQIVFHYQITGTATNGTDYQSIADSIVFPVGTISKQLNIVPLHDTFTEGDETIQIIFDYLKDTLNVVIEDNPPVNTSGTGEIDLNSTVSVFPNPANNQLFISTNHSFNSIEILDINGKLVSKAPFSNSLDISDIDNGIYIVRLIGNQDIVNKRFVKK